MTCSARASFKAADSARKSLTSAEVALHACLKKLLRPAVIDIAVDAFARAQFSNTVLTWKALQDNTDLNLLLNNDAG